MRDYPLHNCASCLEHEKNPNYKKLHLLSQKLNRVCRFRKSVLGENNFVGRGFIFDKKFLCDAEDIFQLILIDLWKYNSFQNFKISENDGLFVNTFEKYLRNVIVKRAVANYFKKIGHRVSVEYSQHYEMPLGEDENANAEIIAKITQSVVCEAGEKFRSEENAKIVREILEHAYKNTPNKGHAKRDIEMFILNKIDGYSVAELSVKFGVSANIVSHFHLARGEQDEGNSERKFLNPYIINSAKERIKK